MAVLAGALCLALPAQLHAHFEASAQSRSTFEVPDEDFLRALVRHVPAGGEDLGALQAVHAEDLALALGCAAGHPVALAEFDQRFGTSLRAALRRLDPSPGFIDEALQAVRERLFLGQEGSAPKITLYQGTRSSDSSKWYVPEGASSHERAIVLGALDSGPSAARPFTRVPVSQLVAAPVHAGAMRAES